MNRFFQALRPFIRSVVTHAPLVFAGGVVVSIASLFLAANLRIDTDFSKLVPDDYESVKALERLRDAVGAESELAIGIVSPSFAANRQFAEVLIPRALALADPETGEPLLGRVDYRRDVEFLEDNALYFATEAELDSLESFLERQIEDAKLKANPFFFDLEEDEEEEDSTGAQLKDLYDTVIGTEYPVSDDSTTLALRFYPTGSQTDVGYIERLYEEVGELIDRLQPTTFHPQMEVTIAGRLQRQLVEVRAITNNVIGTLGLGISAVLLTVVLYFSYKVYSARSGGSFSARLMLSVATGVPVMALVIGLPLLMSLGWTAAIAYLAVDTLNLMTATLGLVLFGLGIDYGIHFYARYTEERGRGLAPVEAVERTFMSTGQAITVGALTTAIAMYVLVVADFRGFSEFGFIAGTGILLGLVSMLVIMPALIVTLERLRLLNLSSARTSGSPARSGGRIPWSTGIIAGSTIAVIAAIVMFPPKFEYNFGALEPEFTEYEARRSVIRRVYSDGTRRNPAYIVADDPDEVPAIVAALRSKAAADTVSPTIRAVESLQDRFPLTPEAQRRKLKRIADIRELLDDSFLSLESDENLEKLERAAQTRSPISLDSIPDFLKQQFTSKTGGLGAFIAVYPSVGLSDGRNSMAFAEDVGRVVTDDGDVYHAGSTSLIAADMLRLMRQESPWIVVATFVIVVLLMRLSFGSWQWAAMAALPLVVGVLWMVLVMEVFDLRLNFYNLIVLPAVLGIGNDAGVHIVHRYREEGAGSIRYVLRSTGEHITMGSLTTMMGFAGPLLSFHPGLRSIGELAVVGIGATLLASLFLLTAVVQAREDRTGAGTSDSLPTVAEAVRTESLD